MPPPWGGTVDGPERLAFASGGVRCEADLYAPADAEPPWPAVVMANVFGAPRAWGLDRFAERFAAAGLAAVPFDYRHFGGSGGAPRRLVDPDRQVADWAAALAHVRSLDAVDADRVAVWGASFSGGHVLAVADRDPAVSAVVSLVPFVDGRAVMAHQTAHLGRLERVRAFGTALADRLLGAVGLGPVEAPTVSAPHGGGLVDTPGAREGFLSIVPASAPVENRMPARVVLDLPFYRPGVGVDLDVPFHLVIAEEDRLLPVGPMAALAERLPDATVHHIDGAHFDAYLDPWFDDVVERQVGFLREALGVTD